jgi:hypothetical protein
MDYFFIRANISRVRRRIRIEKLKLQRLRPPQQIKKISIRRGRKLIFNLQFILYSTVLLNLIFFNFTVYRSKAGIRMIEKQNLHTSGTPSSCNDII